MDVLERIKIHREYEKLPHKLREQIEDSFDKQRKRMSLEEKLIARRELTKWYNEWQDKRPHISQIYILHYLLKIKIFQQEIRRRLEHYWHSYKRGCRYIFRPFRKHDER